MSNTYYGRCAICGRKYHESMGSKYICCFCHRNSRAGMIPVYVYDTGYTLWVKDWLFHTGMNAAGPRKHDIVMAEDHPFEMYEGPSSSCVVRFFMNHLNAGLVLLRSRERYCNDRVVFHLGYHKFMWGLHVKYPNLERRTIWEYMCKLFPEIHGIHESYAAYCFACEAAYKVAELNFKQYDNWTAGCTYCPFVWKYRAPHIDDCSECQQPGARYRHWVNSNSDIEKSYVAVHIKNLALNPQTAKYYIIDD